MRVEQLRLTNKGQHTSLSQFALTLGAAVLMLCCATGAPSMLRAQGAVPQATGVSDQMAAGDKATQARQPRQALTHYEAVLQTSPGNTAALWKASGAAIDIGEVEADEKRREAVFQKAKGYAQRAIESDSNDAESNFAMARALGRAALTVGPRERIKFAKEVRHYALRTLTLDPKHPGAMHVMGVWNAEIMRLNGIVKMIAKTLLGGQILGTASWASAASYLEQSVANDPVRAVHRLDLARVYRDMGRKAEARASYEAAIKAPLRDANDDLYQRQAAVELKALK